MNNIELGFGHALYYPYINIHDENWIKVAALYYDGLARIVPEGYKTRDNKIVRILKDELQLIKDLHPEEREKKVVEQEFITIAREELSDESNRKETVIEISKLLPAKSGFRIHGEKLAHSLREELPRLGLAKKSKKYSPWFDFEPVAGALYMTCLASEIAERKALPIVTDDPIYQPFIRRLQGVKLGWGWRKTDTNHTLASLVIRAAAPESIESVPIDRIVRFRKKHNDERHRFSNAIREFAKNIPNIDDPDSLRDCLNYHKKTIDEAVKDLKLSLTGVKIKCVTSLLGLSVPSWATRLAQIKPEIGTVVEAAGIICMAIGVLLKDGINYYKSRRSSPWSYVLSLERGLDSRTLVKKLLRGATLL